MSTEIMILSQTKHAEHYRQYCDYLEINRLFELYTRLCCIVYFTLFT